MRAARKPDVRSGIVAPGEVARQPVQRVVAEVARRRRLLTGSGARADDQIVFAQKADQAQRIGCASAGRRHR